MVFLRIFQTFVVGAIGYERSAIEPFELFALVILLFLVGILEYVLINLYSIGKFTSMYWLLCALCVVAACAYGWLSFRAKAFSQHDPPYATRDQKLQAINTTFALIEAVVCAWLAVGPSVAMSVCLILLLILFLLLNIHISIVMSFYPNDGSGEILRRVWWLGALVTEGKAVARIPLRRQAELLFLYVLPPLAIVTGAIDFKWRMHVLVVASFVVFGLAAFDKSLDFRLLTRREYWESLAANIAIVLTALAVATGYFAWRGPLHLQPISAAFIAFYALISVPLQELVYRYRLRVILHESSGWAYVVASASLYCWAHVVYQDWIIITGAMALGLIWSAIFVRTREIIGIVLSHVAIGLLAFSVGAA